MPSPLQPRTSSTAPPARLRVAPVLVLTLAVCGAALSPACSDETLVNEGGWNRGRLLVTPTLFQLGPTPSGGTSTEPLTLSNTGGAPLSVQLTLVSATTELSLDAPSEALVLAPGEDLVVPISYSPTDCDPDRASISVDSNDGYLTLPISARPVEGRLHITPNPVDFGRVPSGSCRTIEVEAFNAGSCTLSINDAFIGGDGSYAFTETIDGEPLPTELALPWPIEPGAARQVGITHCPESDVSEPAALYLDSDLASNPMVAVPLRANWNEPCVHASDEEGIDFGRRFIGETHSRTIWITNCSQQAPLVVSDITLEEHPELLGVERFDLPGVSGLPLTLEPWGSYGLSLSYTPIPHTPAERPTECSEQLGCALADGAILTITSEDEAKSLLPIEVSGAGSGNHCPTAVARGRVLEGPTPWAYTLRAHPRQILELDASGSSDVEGAITRYEWEILRSPDASSARLLPDPNDPSPTVLLGLSGEYRFGLRVFDEEGDESCDTAEVLVDVVSPNGIYVELVWADSDGTSSAASSSSDLDLHFLHPNGSWNAPPWDCYWQNVRPNWGSDASDADDPVLYGDRRDGGPELLRFDQPEGNAFSPVVYEIGVSSYGGSAPADATVRVFVYGSERRTLTRTGLRSGEFWHAASINWPRAEVLSVDRLFPSGFP